jgi:hypothetical protein
VTLFRRSIEVEVKEGEDGSIELRGRLLDLRSGNELHGLEAVMRVRVADGVILRVEADMPVVPMPECREALPVVGELEGEAIRPGFSDLVRGVVGSSRGCTHLANLLMNMGNVSVQGRAAFVHRYYDEGDAQEQLAEHAVQLGLINSCVCWREDGPVVRRWRERRERREKQEKREEQE